MIFATILLSIRLWLIGAIYAAIHFSLPFPVGLSAVKKGIILGSTFNSMTWHSVDNKFSISWVRGVLGCDQWTRLVVVNILSVWIFLQRFAYLDSRCIWFCFRWSRLCLMKWLVVDKILIVWIFWRFLLTSLFFTGFFSVCWGVLSWDWKWKYMCSGLVLEEILRAWIFLLFLLPYYSVPILLRSGWEKKCYLLVE